ncbi:restriction endonuclease subunit S [Leucothrix arctica]|uniref:Restriction endonuclease subunit S n=1 Tax=Leucothrix arctica TaxID=1481894 RepID=A0A317C325_9GAMM|nr:restriction endonuclease subunit S [Leucothrix arctica]PWQ93096.1 restriction endonuclease subunit S [Leucothrix arctica]
MIAFPENWQMAKINSVCEHIVDCINKTAPVVDYETPYKMIRTTNVKQGRVNLDVTRFVTEQTFIKWNRRLTPQKNDVVLTREAPLGDVGLIRSNDHVMLGQRTMLYRANPEVLDQNFLYYSLLGGILQAQIRMLGSGSTVEHMRVPDAEQLDVPLPPLSIQKKIAATLTTYDDLIEANNRRIQLLENMAEEIYKEWFVRLRFPGYENVKTSKGAPEGWQMLSIDSLCNLITDGAHSSPKHVESSDYRIATVKDMESNGFNKKTMKTISESDYRKLVKGGCKPSENDILIAKDGSYLKHVFVWRGGEGLVLLSSIAILRPDLEKISPYFLVMLLKQQSTKSMMSSYVSGVAIPRIILKDFKKMMLLVPTFDLMDRFEKEASQIFDQMAFLEKVNQNLVATRDKLLPRLISGKLSVENLDINFPPSMKEALA